MKKIFAIWVIIMMTIGILPCEAQTSSSGLTFDVVCQPLSKSGYTATSLGISKALWGKLHCIKSDNALNSSLLNAGFKCDSKQNVTEYDDQWDEYVTYMKATYSKKTPSGTIYIKKSHFEPLTIQFPSSTEKNKFLNSVKAKGYKSDGGGWYQIPGNEEAHWAGITVRVNGNRVEIVGGGE